MLLILSLVGRWGLLGWGGGNGNDPVNIVLGEHELWIVGKGGVWHVENVKERLAWKYD
jgi:hypothetical protein